MAERTEPLVERDDELATLLRLATSVRTGGAVAVVSGEAGIGKTALVDELSEHVRGTLTVRRGRCDDLDAPPSLAPLREIAPTLSPETRSALEDGDRAALYAAVLADLSRAPGLLVVEDLHWADDATLDLLVHVCRRVEATRSLVVLTVRRGDVGPVHPARRLLRDVATDATQLRLRELSLAGVGDLADGEGVDVEGLHRVSGGNPFFVTQMLAEPSRSLPTSVGDAVLGRARALPASAGDVLTAIAVSPGGVPVDALPALSATAEDDADLAIARGLLALEDGRMRARHELIRRALDAAVLPARRRRTHGRLLDALLDLEPAVEPAELAHHAVGADRDEEVVRWSRRAAARAGRDGAVRAQHRHIEHLLRREAHLHDDELPDLVAEYGYTQYLLGDIGDARASLARAVELADAPGVRGRYLRMASRFAWAAGDSGAAATRGEEAIAAQEQGDDAHELAYAYSNRSQLAMNAGALADARRLGERALSLARAHDDIEVLVHALNNVGAASAWPEPTRALIAESLRLSTAAGLHEETARSYVNLAKSALQQLDHRSCREYCAQALDHCAEHDLDIYATYVVGVRARAALDAGDWGAAGADADAVSARRQGSLLHGINANLVAALLAVRRGDPGAPALARRATAQAVAVGEHQRTIVAAALDAEFRWHDAAGVSLLSDDEVTTVVATAQAHDHVGDSARITAWTSWLEPDVVDGKPRPGGPTFWTERGHPYESAVAIAHVGDDEQRRRAVDVLRDLGAHGTVRALRRHLPDAGISAPRGSNRATRGNPAGLTARQLDVLRLLEGGATNAAIATTLVLSPKTVEHHVTAILAKLEVSNRGEAGAAARRLGIVASD